MEDMTNERKLELCREYLIPKNRNDKNREEIDFLLRLGFLRVTYSTRRRVSIIGTAHLGKTMIREDDEQKQKIKSKKRGLKQWLTDKLSVFYLKRFLLSQE
ncbi:MAG: hypothetical protein WC472_02395 [Candidatus Paceibacterota bacterium]